MLIFDDEIWIMTIQLYRQLRNALEKFNLDTNDLDNYFTEMLIARKDYENTRP